jgi:outer membrane biosynthesis protein TonB
MQTLTYKIDREKQKYLIAFILSALFHIILLLLLNADLYKIDLGKDETEIPEEVTIVFPENKPKRVVENMNENEQVPDMSDLLSDRNSRATNPEFRDQFGNQPALEGNTPFENLTMPSQTERSAPFLPNRKFSRDVLALNKSGPDAESFFSTDEPDVGRADQSAQDRQTTNNIFDQKQFSADQLGSFSLSTYAWEWAPYINAMKRKLQQVWFAPAAYYRLGLIYGYTVIRYEVTREGNLAGYEVLEHRGHESLKQSSINAIESLFPFRPLPENFPEKTLTITAHLIYPNLREGNY